MILPGIGIYEYSNTNVLLGYDPGLTDDPQFQYIKVKEPNKGFDGIRVVLALNYDFPKKTYLVLAKQILDDLKNLTEGRSEEKIQGTLSNEFLKDRIDNLVLQCGTLMHLRFSNEFKLKDIVCDDKTPIGVFGLDQAGKTAILTYLATGNAIKSYTPTLGMNRFTFPGVLSADWEPVFLEVSGRQDFRPLWQEYDDLKGVMYVIDANDHNRLNESLNELEKLLKTPAYFNIPFAVIASKQDLITSISISAISSKINSLSGSTYRIRVFPVSGMTGEGLPAVLHWILDYIWFLSQNPEI